MRQIRLFGVIVLGMVLLAACGLGSNRNTACVDTGVLFQDDFEQSNICGWSLYNKAGAVSQIETGGLRLSTNQPGQIWWTNSGRNFDDVIITVDTEQISGPDNNAYGVICRYQDENNFYIFLISGDGFYAIGKYQSGDSQIAYLSGVTDSEEGGYLFSEAVNQGVAANQIRVGCVGNELSLVVNGLPLAVVNDSAFVTGDIGLGVSTLEPGTAVVQFDNLQVIAP